MTDTTELLGYVERSATNPREISGIAVPYGQVSAPTREFQGSDRVIREAFAPGAFGKWADKANAGKRKMPFRPAHGEKPIGVITEWTDTPEGLAYRGSIFETPSGDEYLMAVDAGLNGVSIEGNYDAGSKRRLRSGVVVHDEGSVHALAGSLSPAYDGAYVSLRDMEDADVADTTEATAASVADKAEPTAVPSEVRAHAERSAVTEIAADARFTTVRAEAVYGRDATDERGEWRSFFRDFEAAAHGDPGAMERQYRHNLQLTDIAHAMARAGDVLSSEIPGAYPNLYLPGLFTPRILKSRPMANFIGSFAIDNALPRIFAKVTTSTTATVQAGQTTNPAASDFATTAITATPLLYGASSLVARQVVDGASPAAETMLLQDMYEAYGQVTEAAAVTAVEAGASASGTAITAATPYAGTLGNVVKYQATRFNPAEGQFVPSALYSVLLAQGDTTGRPFLPMIGLTNSDGSVAAGAVSGGILGAQTILSWGSTVNVVVTLRRSDYVAFESPTLSFRYEQATGPAGFNIGCWGYFVVAARLGGLSVTAA